MFGKDKKDKGDTLKEIQSVLSSGGGRDLRVIQKGDTYEIHGEVDSIADKQSLFSRVTQAAGDMGIVNKLDVKSASEGTPDVVTVPAGAEPPMATDAVGTRVHEVERGDTLSHLAKRYYRDASRYMKIFEANRDQLDDPDKIQVGQKLRIPQ